MVRLLQHGHVREQVELLEDHADPGAQLVDVGVGVGDLLALDEDLAAGGDLEQVDAAQQRGLAGARRADDAHDLPVADVEVDALEHLVVAEVLVEVLARRWRRSSPRAGVVCGRSSAGLLRVGSPCGVRRSTAGR